ncbi:MAG: hypothetical protein KDI07_14860 [Anaerolineae bacterium]|nr:hypothetical protein [Anaerolineae bacterium]
MALLARKKILLAKIEGTYGTDPTPTGSANAIQTSQLSITPLAGPTVSRDLNRSTLGNDLQIQVGSFVQVSFMVEIAGGGAVDTAPAYGPLLEACGFSETVNASTSVVYAPVSTAFDSVTMYFHHDGQLHKVTGARGTVALSLNPGEIPHYAFTFTGLYNTPSSTTDATPDFSDFVTPLPVNNTNTTTFSLHSVSATMISCSLDVANNVVYRNVVGNESVELIDRAPSGQIVIEAPTITTKNWFSTALASTTGALSIVHGTATGNIVTIGAPNAQIVSPTYGESDGISTLAMGLALVPGSSGNDEITITTT